MKYLIIIYGLIIMSCNNSTHNNKHTHINNVGRNIDSNLTKSISTNLDSIQQDSFDTSSVLKDYLNVCDNLNISFGAIQNDKVIKFIYPFGSCNSNEQYEIIWVEKNKKYTNANSDSLIVKFKKEKAEGFPSFNIAVFELPKIPVKDLEDEFDMELRFPCEAKIFLRINDSWRFYGNKTLTSFISFTEMEMEIVNKIDGHHVSN